MYNKTVIFTNAVDNRRTASKVLAIQQNKVISTNAVDNWRTASKVRAIQCSPFLLSDRWLFFVADFNSVFSFFRRCA